MLCPTGVMGLARGIGGLREAVFVLLFPDSQYPYTFDETLMRCDMMLNYRRVCASGELWTS